MADGTVEILMKHKFQELRRSFNNIMDVSFENTSEQTYTANLFDNKTAFSQSAVIGDVELFHLDTFSGSPNRLMISVFNPVTNKTVTIHKTPAGTPATSLICHSVDNETLVATLENTVALPADITEVYYGGYCAFDNKFYITAQNTAASTTTILRLDNDFTNLTELDVSSSLSYQAAPYFDNTNGRIFIPDRTSHELVVVDIDTFALISNVNMSPCLNPTFAYYASAYNKIYVAGSNGLYSVDGTTYAVTLVDGTLTQGSDLEAIDGNLVFFRPDTATTSEYVTWNMSSDTEISRKTLSSSANTTSAQRFWLDDRDNIYLCSNLVVDVFNKAGDKLTLEEMNSLIDQLFATQSPYFCPHGRPVIINISVEELDKRFGRI